MLADGVHTHLKHEPNDAQRLLENEALVDYDNHRGARDNITLVLDTVHKEVTKGWVLVLPLRALLRLRYAMLCALGVTKQINYALDGTITEKDRLTHDQSFHLLINSESLNMLTDLDLFPYMIYGFCFLRMIHQAMSMCFHFPLTRIVCFMWDYKSAYRRLHYDSRSAQRSIAIIGGVLYLWLRLIFGGAGNPPAWCAISEIQADLANDIMADTSWDVSDLASADFIAALPTTECVDDSIPFDQAKPTMVLPPPREYGAADMFVDDGNCLVLDESNRVTRALVAVLKSVAAIMRPCAFEHITRDPPLEAHKTNVLGKPKEIQLILGWICNFRSLNVSLPPEKGAAWTIAIESVLAQGSISKNQLEVIIGRLSHTATVIPLSRFYLGRFYSKLQRFCGFAMTSSFFD